MWSIGERSGNLQLRVCVSKPSILIAAVLLACVSSVLAHPKWCEPGEACWPSEADFAALYAQLGPSEPRKLFWTGPPMAAPAPVPVGSPDDQPLYGFGVEGLAALYVVSNDKSPCFTKPGEARPACFAATRNNPLEGWRPLVTVFATEEQHVVTALQFARKHSLCVAVAGTGHDFINRHSCPGGVFIRTTLLKGVTVSDDGTTITAGAGSTFEEVQKTASEHGLFVAAGWARTVGIVGWSLGGGHGPFANAVGLGTDNIVSARVVTANGEVVTASEEENADLLWALRGGGGSAFGILTSITIRAHRNPNGGFIIGRITWSSSMCDGGAAKFQQLMQGIMEVTGKMSERWSALFATAGQRVSNVTDPQLCGGNWTLYAQSAFLGSVEEAQPELNKWTQILPGALVSASVQNASTWFELMEVYPLETITPVAWALWGVPSVLIDAPTALNGRFTDAVEGAVLQGCIWNSSSGFTPCQAVQVYVDVGGLATSPPRANTSTSEAFKTAFAHVVHPLTSSGWIAPLGSGAYFSESRFDMPEDQWAKTYWGSNYPALQSVKRSYDPDSVFWCHHCVEA